MRRYHVKGLYVILYCIFQIILWLISLLADIFRFIAKKGLFKKNIFTEIKNLNIAKEYYNNGQIKSETPYRWGKKNGTRKEYYESGNLFSAISYSNDKKHGTETLFLEDGRIQRRSNYIKDLKHGNEIEYFSKQDKINFDNTLENTLPLFKSNRFSKNITFDKGVKNGEEIIIDDSKNIVLKRQYKDGILEGLETAYYESGKLKSEAIYKDGKKDGIEKMYFESGLVQSEISHIPGVDNYIGKQYAETGELLCENHYSRNGSLTKIVVYDANGQIKEIQNEKHGIIAEYENGIPKNGNFKKYNEANILIEEYTYENGIKNGLARRYYDNGKLKWEGIYKNNIINATNKRFDDLGCLIDEYDLYQYVVNDMRNANETSKFYMSEQLLLNEKQIQEFVKKMEDEGILSKEDINGNRLFIQKRISGRKLDISTNKNSNSSKIINNNPNEGTSSPRRRRLIKN